MKIVLLGVGYIGSELLKYLPRDVVALDHGKYYSGIKNKDITSKNSQLYKGDLLDPKILDKCIHGGDIIINLTGGGGNAACTQNPIKYINTYILGMQEIVKKAEKYGIKHIIHASTISVYPSFHTKNRKETLITEKTIPHPQSIYGFLKFASEQILKTSSLNYTILRFANIYGYTIFNPIQEAGALGKFIKAAFNNEDITIYGSGNQNIDYVHIKDICKCITMLLKKDVNTRETYNVGSGEAKTINEIANIAADKSSKHLKREMGITYIPTEDPPINYPIMSINKIKNKMGWEPKMTLEEGIEEEIVKNANLER